MPLAAAAFGAFGAEAFFAGLAGASASAAGLAWISASLAFTPAASSRGDGFLPVAALNAARASASSFLASFCHKIGSSSL
jgi:hypothetical protein